MSWHVFKCNSCGFSDEFVFGGAISDPVPEVCPKCGKGKMEKQFSPPSTIPDIIGGYDYMYGKKAWRNKSQSEQYDILSPDSNGRYKDPW
jgi:putative FmdB family regulatory protein